MLDNFRAIKIHWQTANQQLPNVLAHAHDVQGRKLQVQVVADDLYLLWARNGDKHKDKFTLIDINTFEIYFSENLLEEADCVQAALLLEHNGDQIESRPFRIKIVKGVA